MTLNKTYIKKILHQEEIKIRNKIFTFIAYLGVIIFFLIYSNVTDLLSIYNGLPALFTILHEMMPPNFDNLNTWLIPALDSISMSISATFIAAVVAFPISLLGSRNINKNSILYIMIRIFLSIFRSIPEIILGLIIVVSVGFGIISGTLAIAIHSVGMLGKFFSESIERTNNDITEIIISTGATKQQVIFFGILPQVFQEFIDLIMYRWEYNFRQSTILGIVGAGGIGLELISSIRLMQYDEVSAILIIIIFLVTTIDFLSSRIRFFFKE